MREREREEEEEEEESGRLPLSPETPDVSARSGTIYDEARDGRSDDKDMDSCGKKWIS